MPEEIFLKITPPKIFLSPTKNSEPIPLWALSLATYLRDKKVKASIEIFDSQLIPLEDIKKRIIKTKPNFVGISPTLFSYRSSLDLARTVKTIGAKVVFGGHQATGLKKEILETGRALFKRLLR